MSKAARTAGPTWESDAVAQRRRRPIVEAVEALLGESENAENNPRVVLLTPQGRPLDQDDCLDFSQSPHVILICGRYEGFDDRIRTVLDCEEVSIGDYVLSGGEIPAMVVIEATSRLIPGVPSEPISPGFSGSGRSIWMGMWMWTW